MTNIEYENAIAEVIEYLKGIKQEDINKISPQFIAFLQENASKEYKPQFDYTKPLSELKLMNTSRAIICFICYKYWCKSKEEKEEFYNLLKKNDEISEKEWEEKSKNIFKSKKMNNNTVENNYLPIENTKTTTLWKKLKNCLKRLFGRKGE